MVDNVAIIMKQAEQNMVNLDMNVEDPDESMRRDEERDVKSLEDKLKIKDNLLHIRNAKLMEKEGEIAELKEIIDQKVRQIKVTEAKVVENEEEVKK